MVGKYKDRWDSARARIMHAWQAFRLSERREAGLEPFLSFLARELELHVPLERAIHRAAEQCPLPLRHEIHRVLARSTQKGMSIEKSWALAAQEWKSPVLTRGTTVLIHLARQGITETGIQGLHRVAEDLRIAHQTVLKRYASALTLYALLFIGASAIVPALFLAFVTIGSRFLELSFTPLEMILLTLLGFPALDALILILVWARTPVSIHSAGESRAPPERLSSWNPLFFQSMEGKACARSAAIEGASLFLVGWTIYLQVQPAGISPFLILGGLALGPLLAHLAWREWTFERETARLEAQLPDSLVLLAALPTSLAFESRLRELGDNGTPPLAAEWARVGARIEKGESVPVALQELGRGRASPALEKTRHLLIRAYESGWNVSVPASTLAHELLISQSLVEERRAVLGVEKMTLLAAGGILVPLLLGTMLGVVSALPGTSDGLIEQGSGVALMAIIPWTVRGYLFLYSLLAGVFVGFMEGRSMQGIGYALALIPLAQLVFSLGAWVGGGGS